MQVTKLMQGKPAPPYKIGQLASATGLTVRTLHHYDHVGLVCPSTRTSSGHRLYQEADIQRLYQVLALRQLGLSLGEIGDALGGNASLDTLLRRHQEHLDQQLAAMRALRARLSSTLARWSDSTSGDGTDFVALIREVITVDETVHKYFSQEQLAELAERRERIGADAIAGVEASWQELIPRVQQALDAGTDPASAEAQEMAREWMELLEQFHGGDEGLRDSLYQMYDENADWIRQQHAGPSPEQLDFIQRANAARA